MRFFLILFLIIKINLMYKIILYNYLKIFNKIIFTKLKKVIIIILKGIYV